MPCMKCGKSAEDGQVFCARCREIMENYPIKPDVHIQLPNHTVAPAPKRSSEKEWTQKKARRTSSLQRQIRWMWLVILALLLALIISNAKSFREAVKSKISNIGKDYTYVDPTK